MGISNHRSSITDKKIPKPKQYKEVIKEWKESHKEKELERIINKPIEKTGFKNPAYSKLLKFYSIPLILFLILVTGLVIMILLKVFVLFIIIYAVLLSPVMLISLVFLLIRFFMDKNAITGKIITLTSRNCLSLKFLLPQRRTVTRVAIVNNDNTCNVGKAIYIVDSEAIYMNEFNIPESLYFPNIPTPIKIKAEEYLQKFNDKFNKGELEDFVDSDNNKIDISLSSANLDEFKRTKMFSDFTKKEIGEYMKIIIIFGIITGILAIGLVISLMIG